MEPIDFNTFLQQGGELVTAVPQAEPKSEALSEAEQLRLLQTNDQLVAGVGTAESLQPQRAPTVAEIAALRPDDGIGTPAEEGLKTFTATLGRGVAGLLETVPGSLKTIAILGKAVNDHLPEFLKEDDYMIEDRLLYKLGDAITKAIEDNLPEDKKSQDSFIANDLPRLIGGIAGFILGGEAGEITGLGRGVAESLLGAGQFGAAAYEKAIHSGATEDQAVTAAELGAASGSLVALPLGKVAGRLVNPGGLVSSSLVGLGEGAGLGLIQGSADYLGEKQYNPEASFINSISGPTAGNGLTMFALNIAANVLGRKGAIRAAGDEAVAKMNEPTLEQKSTADRVKELIDFTPDEEAAGKIRRAAGAAVINLAEATDPWSMSQKAELAEALRMTGQDDLADILLSSSDARKGPELLSQVGAENSPEAITDEMISRNPITDLDQLSRVGFSVEDVNIQRQMLGLDQLPPPERQKWITAFQKAMMKGAGTAKGNAKFASLAQSLAEDPRPVSTWEQAGLMVYVGQLKQVYREALDEGLRLSAEGRGVESNAAFAQAEGYRQVLELATTGVRNSRTETARSLAFGNARLETEEFKPDFVIRQATAAKKAPLTVEETKQFHATATKVEKAQTHLEATEKTEAERQITRVRAEAEASLKRVAKKKGKTASAQQEIDMAKALLRSLGLKVNNFLGLTAEGYYAIGKMAKAYVETGLYSLDAVVEKIQSEIPELSDIDIYDGINAADPKAVPRQVSVVTKHLNQIKSQAKLMSRIERIEQGLDVEAKTPREGPSRDVKLLRHWLNKLEMQLYKTEREDALFEATMEKIQELRKVLSVDEKVAPVNLSDAKRLLGELRSTKNARAETERLRKVLADPDLLAAEAARLEQARVDRSTKQISPELKKARRELSLAKKDVRNAIENVRPFGFGEGFRQAVMATKTMQTVMDMSFVLRQNLLLVTRRPITATKSFAKAFTSFFSKNSAEDVIVMLRSMPEQYIRDVAKLELMEPNEGGVGARNEFFNNRLLKKIPGIGSFVRASDRHSSTFTNLMRTAVFDKFVKNNPQADVKTLQAYAQYINEATGSGTLSAGTAKAASYLLFAPKFTASRFQAPARLWTFRHMPTVRKEIAKDMVATVATGLAFLELARQKSESDPNIKVTSDPVDPDFGKIRIGNQRIDIWGGFLPGARAIARIGIGLGGGQPYAHPKGQDVLDIGLTFLKYRANPLIGIPVELGTGKNIVGERVGVEETFVRAVTPFILQDISDAWKQEGIPGALRAAPLTFLGVGVSSYGKNVERPIFEKVMKHADYTLRSPQYPERIKNNLDAKEHYDDMFEYLFLAQMAPSLSLLIMLPKEQAKLQLSIYAEQARNQVLQLTGRPEREPDLSRPRRIRRVRR